MPLGVARQRSSTHSCSCLAHMGPADSSSVQPACHVHAHGPTSWNPLWHVFVTPSCTCACCCCRPALLLLHVAWNILDCAVVVLGWMDIALSGDEYTFLRTVRVLRPLRTITHIRGLKVGSAPSPSTASATSSCCCGVCVLLYWQQPAGC